jgi:electron transport complex protein RnfB
MAHTINDVCDGCTACVRMCPVEAITGEKDKKHDIDSEICIDCGVCGRVCPVSAIVDQHGKTVEKLKRSQWPKPTFLEGCVACATCVETCPFACLDIMDPPPKGDKHSKAFLKDDKSCVGCGMCEDACPVSVIVMKKP